MNLNQLNELNGLLLDYITFCHEKQKKNKDDHSWCDVQEVMSIVESDIHAMQDSQTPQTAKVLGVKFAEIIRNDLTPEQLDKVVELNRNEQNPNVCHTHDFIDSNESMIEAIDAVLEREIDVSSQKDADLVNAAWSYAKRNDFFMEV